MPALRRLAFIALACAALLASPRAAADIDDAEVQYQLASLLFDETRFSEALDAYRKAVDASDRDLALRARIGVVRTALRIGQFQEAQREGASLRTLAPNNPEALSAYADALWSA